MKQEILIYKQDALILNRVSLCEIGHSEIKQHVLIIKYKALILNTTLQYRILLKLIKLLDMSDNPKKKLF